MRSVGTTCLILGMISLAVCHIGTADIVARKGVTGKSSLTITPAPEAQKESVQKEMNLPTAGLTENSKDIKVDSDTGEYISTPTVFGMKLHGTASVIGQITSEAPRYKGDIVTGDFTPHDTASEIGQITSEVPLHKGDIVTSDFIPQDKASEIGQITSKVPLRKGDIVTGDFTPQDTTSEISQITTEVPLHKGDIAAGDFTPQDTTSEIGQITSEIPLYKRDIVAGDFTTQVEGADSTNQPQALGATESKAEETYTTLQMPSEMRAKLTSSNSAAKALEDSSQVHESELSNKTYEDLFLLSENETGKEGDNMMNVSYPETTQEMSNSSLRFNTGSGSPRENNVTVRTDYGSATTTSKTAKLHTDNTPKPGSLRDDDITGRVEYRGTATTFKTYTGHHRAQSGSVAFGKDALGDPTKAGLSKKHTTTRASTTKQRYDKYPSHKIEYGRSFIKAETDEALRKVGQNKVSLQTTCSLVADELAEETGSSYTHVTVLTPGGPCSGSLMDDLHVLTAAHCFLPGPRQENLHETDLLWYTAVEVEIGAASPSAPGRGGYRLKAVAVLLHSDYDRLLANTDLAVLRLNQSIKFTQDIHPVCFATAEDQMSEDCVISVKTPEAASSGDADRRHFAPIRVHPAPDCTNSQLLALTELYMNAMGVSSESESDTFRQVVKGYLSQTMCSRPEEDHPVPCIRDSGAAILCRNQEDPQRETTSAQAEAGKLKLFAIHKDALVGQPCGDSNVIQTATPIQAHLLWLQYVALPMLRNTSLEARLRQDTLFTHCISTLPWWKIEREISARSSRFREDHFDLRFLRNVCRKYVSFLTCVENSGEAPELCEGLEATRLVADDIAWGANLQLDYLQYFPPAPEPTQRSMMREEEVAVSLAHRAVWGGELVALVGLGLFLARGCGWL